MSIFILVGFIISLVIRVVLELGSLVLSYYFCIVHINRALGIIFSTPLRSNNIVLFSLLYSCIFLLLLYLCLCYILSLVLQHVISTKLCQNPIKIRWAIINFHSNILLVYSILCLYIKYRLSIVYHIVLV